MHSVLFAGDAPPEVETLPQPVCFSDLNLDQIVAGVTDGKGYTGLGSLFHAPLHEVDAVSYRQEVFQDLERDQVRKLVAAFTGERLSEKYAYRAHEMRTERWDRSHYHRARLFLNSAERYCDAVCGLGGGLGTAAVRSRGLRGLRDYLAGYVASAEFVALREEVRRLEDALDAVRYCIVVDGSRVTVGRYSGEIDYSEQVLATFERFRQDASSDYSDVRAAWKEEDFASLSLLEMVAKLYPRLFAELDVFCREHAGYLDQTIGRADRELWFYLSYLEYVRPLREAGLAFSYPQMFASSKTERALDTFDLALARQLNDRGGRVVCNDVTLCGPERILVISGPNNGGKTTLARAIGQLHYLAALGCPVPGRDVRLFLCDAIYTHFERQEDLATLAGKLQEELDRLRAALEQATPASLLVLNEAFNSTTAQDAAFLSRRILERIGELDALAVCVTFIDELASLDERTVSMVSQVDPADPAIRTHRLLRVPADGRAYARAIARKYGLTYEQITAGRRVA